MASSATEPVNNVNKEDIKHIEIKSESINNTPDNEVKIYIILNIINYM